MSHCILAQTSCAEADSLAERTNPLVIIITMTEVFFIVSFKTERTEFPSANVVVLLFDYKFFCRLNIS